ncbi:MAG: hypothetical protein QOG38_2079 [Hyphomicrobiales bacterium]|nr:hypothetical protein [Hyphomicrobiales bacterium]
MKSVRMLAAGAVVLFALPFMTAPVRACDDRFIKKCEAESEAAFNAEQQTTAFPAPRRKTPRAHATFEKPSARRMHAPPRFIARTRPAAPEPMTLASDDARPAGVPESPMARRFRGFIDPQPMTLNTFEALRRPRLDAEHLTPAATPLANDAVAGPDDASMAAELSTVAVPAAVVTEPAPQGAAQPVAVAEAGMPAPVFAQAVASSPDDGKSDGFPVHKLVLTLCAALGVASALRFIVRA